MRLNKKSAVAAMCLALAGCGMFGKENCKSTARESRF